MRPPRSYPDDIEQLARPEQLRWAQMGVVITRDYWDRRSRMKEGLRWAVPVVVALTVLVFATMYALALVAPGGWEAWRFAGAVTIPIFVIAAGIAVVIVLTYAFDI